MTQEPQSASDVHPDVLQLAQQITDKVDELLNQVETLDANKWFAIANQIESLNGQLKGLLVTPPAESRESSRRSSRKDT